MALRRIEFLEQQFTQTRQSIKIIKKLEDLEETYILRPHPENKGVELVDALDRLDELEYQYGWIQAAVTEIQEYTGLETGYFPRLPYRWEGPPPATFRYRGKEYYDQRPIVVTATGPAGLTSTIKQTTEEDGDWEVVAREQATRAFAAMDDRGTRVHIRMLSYLNQNILSCIDYYPSKAPDILRTGPSGIKPTIDDTHAGEPPADVPPAKVPPAAELPAAQICSEDPELLKIRQDINMFPQEGLVTDERPGMSMVKVNDLMNVDTKAASPPPEDMEADMYSKSESNNIRSLF
jgi:hypothetical protein